MRPARRSSSSARCAAAGSVDKALTKASQLLCAEFKFPENLPPTWGLTCLDQRAKWKEWTTGFQSKVEEGYKKRSTWFRARSAIKSCQRLFDLPCEPCDKKSSSKAREEWCRFVASPVTHDVTASQYWSGDPVLKLKERVRELLGTSWGKKLREERPVYVPDQQGCLERRRINGGSLAVPPLSFAETMEVANVTRLGVAKTKGKHRVVTMQSAGVKERLSYIHETLYDHISSFGWVVRGEVTKSDFETVKEDRRGQELLVSGDYENATNNIYSDAVLAIVEVICECEHLTSEESQLLKKSFTNVVWRSLSGVDHPVLRGSMMGNLISFPVLCLINKACLDIARDYDEGEEKGRKRVCRINGDDCMFAASRRLVSVWRDVTSHFGLVVNEQKTGLSDRWLELNSRQYDCRLGRFVAKPVLSFCLVQKENTSDLLSQVVKGCEGLRRDVKLFAINSLLRSEIEIRPISAGNISKDLWRILVKRKWFRNALDMGPLPIVSRHGRRVSTGVFDDPTAVHYADRSVPTTVGPIPKPRFYSFVDKLLRETTEAHVRRWRGQCVWPDKKRFDRSVRRDQYRAKKLLPRKWLSLEKRYWVFSWPTEILKFLEDKCFDRHVLLGKSRDTWVEDHVLLSTRIGVLARPFVEDSQPRSFPPVLPGSFIREYDGARSYFVERA